MTQSAQTQFVGVLMPVPLAVALKMTAAARGTTQSAVIRDALAKDLAQFPAKPARPA